MVLLEALLELDGLRQPVPLEALALRSRAVLDRRRPLLADLPAEVRTIAATGPRMGALLARQPGQGVDWRKSPSGHSGALQAGRIDLRSDQTCLARWHPLAAMLRELVDYRLAA